MKRLNVTLLSLMLVVVAASGQRPRRQSVPQGVWAWPGADVLLPPNGVILLTGHQSDQAQLEKVADLKPALVSESGDRVALVVVEGALGYGESEPSAVASRAPFVSERTLHITFKEPPPAHWADLSDTKWAVNG